MPAARLAEVTTSHRRRFAADLIEHAAIELFLAQPIENVTINQLAETAGVSVRNFYRYFASKEEIMLAQPMRRAEAIRSATSARPASERPFEAMRAAIDALSGSDDPDLRRWQRAVSRGRAVDRMQQSVVAVTSPILSRALADRAGTSPLDLWPDVAGVTVATALVVGARRWAVEGGSLRTHILRAIDIVGAGLHPGPPMASRPAREGKPDSAR